jgi:hypothetical protein
VAAEEADAADLAAELLRQAEPEPALPDHLHWIWRAWHRLTDERPWIGGGMAPAHPGRIPWTAVAAWCERRGYGPEEEEALESGIAALDVEFLAWHDEQARERAARQR